MSEHDDFFLARMSEIFPPDIMDMISKIQPMERPEGEIFQLSDYQPTPMEEAETIIEVNAIMDALVTPLDALVKNACEMHQLVEEINSQPLPEIPQEILERACQLRAEGHSEDAVALLEEHMSPTMLKLGYLMLRVMGIDHEPKEIPEDVSSAEALINDAYSEGEQHEQ